MKKMDYSTPCFPVLHHLPEFAQTHVHRVIDDIQPSHPLLTPFSCLQSFIALGSFLMSCFLHLVSFNFLAVVTLHSTFGVQDKRKPLLPLFPLLYAIKWWDQIPWSYFLECWALSQVFHLHRSPSSRSSLVPLHCLLLEGYYLHSWGCLYRQLGLSLGFLLCSHGLYFSFSAGTILFWLLQLCEVREPDSAPFFFLKFSLAVQSLFCFHIICNFFFYFYEKCHW